MNIDFQLPKGILADVYAFILNDLEEAEKLLPESQELSGRADRYAAKTLPADVYLHLERWSEASDKALEVINSGKYVLIEVSEPDDFYEIFGPLVDKSSEEIFYIKGFFDNISHDKLMVAVRKHYKVKWMLLYIERWLVAPLQREDGTLEARTKGVPQGSVIGPLLANLYLHYCMDMWLVRNYPDCKFERYADDAIIHCKSGVIAKEVRMQLASRMQTCGLELHPQKTQIVYCKDSNRKGAKTKQIKFDFLGYTFMPRMAKNSIRGVWFTNWLPAVSKSAMKRMSEEMSSWKVFRTSGCTLTFLANTINPVIRGWINYYGKFYNAKLRNFMYNLNVKIAKWARRKYKRLRISDKRAMNWLGGVSQNSPNLFAHWMIGSKPSINGRIIGAV